MEDIGVSATALETLERDFQNVIQELENEDSLERFREEYEKLHRALKKSHENEKRLIGKCQELSQELISNGGKIQTAIKMSEGDHSTIEALKKEIEKAWKMVDSTREKDQHAKEIIQDLKKEAMNLEQLVAQGSSLNAQRHEVPLIKITEEKRELLREQEQLSFRVENLTKEIRDASERHKKIEAEVTEKQDEIKRLQEKMNVLKRENAREVRRFEHCEAQCRELTNALQVRTKEVDVRSKAIRKYDDVIATLRLQKDKDKLASKKNASTIEHLMSQLAETKKSTSEFTLTTNQLTKKINDIDDETHRKEYEINSQNHEYQKLLHKKDQKHTHIHRIRHQNEEIKKEHENLLRQETILAKQLASLKRSSKEMILAREKEELHHKQLYKTVDKEIKEQEKVNEDIAVEISRKKELEAAIERETIIGASLKLTIAQLEQDRNQYTEEVSDVNIKCTKATENLKVGLIYLEDLQRQISETSKRLAEHQRMYEEVRTDRNLYSKKLIEAQDEISELKQKFKIMDHQIDQLKGELVLKEKRYHNEQSKQKTEKEKLIKIRKEANEFLEKFETAKKKSDSLNQEIKQLTKIINHCDTELSTKQQQFLAATNERDILGTQLIRRNDELALLYEKLRIQQQTANNGEMQYRERLVDIRTMKLKISELKRNIHMTQVRMKNIGEIKAHIVTLQRQLTLEQTKVKALSEELENPQNYLRWRKLEGEDLKDSEMVQKIKSLQRRIISKTEESVEKDIVISEMDKLYIELRAILARQPGPEVAEQLNIYQRELRKKNVQMKSIASELNMSATQISESKYEIERLSRELEEVKKMYFDIKNSNQQYLSKAKKTWKGLKQFQTDPKESVSNQSI
eukprot:Tbor_TRINITY_DN3057_c0_g1::TRINITY_DN3057_c0_g1_i1::g.17325::m.17325